MTRARVALVEPQQAEDFGGHLFVFFRLTRDECGFARSEVAGLYEVSCCRSFKSLSLSLYTSP